MKQFISLSLALSALAWAPACSSPPSNSATPDPDPGAQGGSSTPEGKTCERDQDCTPTWTPRVNGCGPVERCMESACIKPPAMTGVANSETGRLVFETPMGPRQYRVEVVDESYETQRGLMCRDSMADDWGMVFLMPTTRVQSFWMKNTLIPLDMVFLDEEWQVVGVLADVPPLNLQGRSVGKPSRYVLELNAGVAAQAGIEAGTKARFYAPGG
ncbi:MAG: DUF192 domain-containing protein [Bradymonadia bacterium]